MAKNKYGPALFEVIKKDLDGKRGTGTPAPACAPKGSPQQPDQPPPEETVPDEDADAVFEQVPPPEHLHDETNPTPTEVRTEPETVQPPDSKEVSEPAGRQTELQEPSSARTVPTSEPSPTDDWLPPGDEDATDDETAGWFWLDAGFAYFRFTSTSAAIAIFIVAVVLAGTFLIGQRTGHGAGYAEGWCDGQKTIQTEVTDEIDKVRQQLPAVDLFSDLKNVERTTPAPSRVAASPEDGKTEPAKQPGVEGWVSGFNYLVVQGFRAEAKADALSAQAFLADNGIETELVESEGARKWQLITKRGFDFSNPAQKQVSIEFQSTVRQLGKVYVSSGGRYALEGYYRKLTGSHW